MASLWAFRRICNRFPQGIFKVADTPTEKIIAGTSKFIIERKLLTVEMSIYSTISMLASINISSEWAQYPLFLTVCILISLPIAVNIIPAYRTVLCIKNGTIQILTIDEVMNEK